MSALSASFADEESESEIASRAEATLRSHYAALSRTSSGRGAPAATAPRRPVAPRARPRGLATDAASSVSSGGGGGTKRAWGDDPAASSAKRRQAPPPSTSFFLPLPPASRAAQKGAYRLDASAPSDPVTDALGALGVDAAEHGAVRSALQRGARVIAASPRADIFDDGDGSCAKQKDKAGAPTPGPVAAAAADDDTASFSRRHAVTHAEMYRPGDCPICEETMAFVYHAAKRTVGAARANGAARLLSTQQRQRERLTRAIQARANLSDKDQKRHEVLYNIEHAMRGRWDDERIFRVMLVLRREWIEKNLEYFEIPYVPWTLAMLRVHYDPASDHFDQPTRQVKVELKRARDLHETMFRAASTGGVIDFRAVKAFIDLSKTCREYRDELGRLLDEGEPNVAESLRVLADAIARTTHNQDTLKLTQDPDTAAGAVVVGGDSRSAVGLGAGREPHSGYEMNHLSGF